MWFWSESPSFVFVCTYIHEHLAPVLSTGWYFLASSVVELIRSSPLKSIFGYRRHLLVRSCLLMRWIETLAFIESSEWGPASGAGGDDNGEVLETMWAHLWAFFSRVPWWRNSQNTLEVNPFVYQEDPLSTATEHGHNTTVFSVECWCYCWPRWLPLGRHPLSSSLHPSAANTIQCVAFNLWRHATVLVASDPVTAGQGQDNERDDTEVIS